jgi:hypothetical protein
VENLADFVEFLTNVAEVLPDLVGLLANVAKAMDEIFIVPLGPHHCY